MQQLPPVNVEYIKGLSPTLSLRSKINYRTNRRSTVGTITEIYDYLKNTYMQNVPYLILPESGKTHYCKIRRRNF
jgi:excinuclease UvrABC ATPase subunit